VTQLVVPRLKPFVDYGALAELLAADDDARAAAAAAYEETLRAHFGAARVYALSSGRAALALGLRALGIGAGDDVAIPAFTCSAVADAVLSVGAIPHLVDVSPRHFGLEARSLRRVLARGRTRAAVTAPLFGTVPPAEEIEGLFAEHGVPWIEDIAQAFGSRRGGKAAGAAAPLAVLSTNFDKPYTTGRGGVLVVNDAALAEKADRLVSRLPVQSDAEAEVILKGLVISDFLFDEETYEPFVSVELGYLYAAAEGDAYALGQLVAEGGAVAARHALAAREKLMPETKGPLVRRLVRWFFPRSAVPGVGEMSRLAPLLAAVGGRHLPTVAADGERRRRLAATLDDIFAENRNVRAPLWGGADDEPWPIRYPAFVRDWERRPDVIKRLAAAGYEAGPFIYPRPLSGQFPYYKLSRLSGRYLRGAWRAAAAVVNLPLHAGVDEEDARRMAEAMRG
jgi:dTDP-4-amino-4,6-dideoxygalactose transaminase